ncbi:hypothetical protein VCRA2121O260_110004 [Vibrio crassostreae]|nr:hypothetical protein VCRA2119O243_120140 [Vibrio crassostreae]CAK2544292.1 hypothetical protein VCRA2119O385_110170 [Vibrio crassostreae]CAK2611753.1 hypothetical protein VCRA2120O249_120141 [Vibrio crassostreae]CAK3134020.1 hypothetical protein VCRA2121O259_130141 [Vibrio crassostreae]CAK3289270.1 hypothetical protein VCRA2120O257_120140 [Vibrio crassostreae]
MGNSTVIAVPLPIVKVRVLDPSIKISDCRAILWIALVLHWSVF